jgi:MFS family permease
VWYVDWALEATGSEDDLEVELMTTSTVPAVRQTRGRRERQVVRAAVAATLGSTIVWYDFFLYAFAATTVFGGLFFPSADTFAGTVIALGAYAAGFAARPLGAVLLGRLGDRIGRRATLIASFLLIALATLLTGLLPAHDRIGILGGVLLGLLRIVQGLGVGGQWAGSVLLPVEWGQRGRRGLVGSWPQLGVPAGLALAYGSLRLFTLWLGEDGWRVPFLLGFLLVGVALYVRLGVRETPVFSKLLEERRIEEAPVVTVLARQWREVVLTTLLRTGQQTPFLIFTAFLLTYGGGVLKLAQSQVTGDVMIAAGVSVLTVPFWGFVSDLAGRRRLVMFGAVLMLLWSYPYWYLLNSGTPEVVLAAVVASLAIHDIQWGPQATLIAESFTGRLRYTGASLGHTLASLTADGPALLVAYALFQAFHGTVAIVAYMTASAAVSLVAALLLRDRRLQDMSVEYDEHPVPVAAPST